MIERPISLPACLGYIRVSTERQAGEKDTSLADQQRLITQSAATRGMSVGAWYRDEGASGATVAGRPEFSRLLRECEANPRPDNSPGYIFVLNDSRFGRFDDSTTAILLQLKLRGWGWLVVFCQGGHSEDASIDLIFRAIGGRQASEYRKNLQHNSRQGMRGRADQGFWTREAPFGYRRKVVFPESAARILERGQLKAPKECVALVPHEKEAEIVRWIFAQYAGGAMSLGGLARELLAAAPDRRWSRTVLQHLLRNPVYVGHVVGGRRPSVADRSRNQVRPESEWYGREFAHEAIVTQALFDRVQTRLVENRKRKPGQAATYLLSGVMRCTYCGSHYCGGGLGGKASSRRAAPRIYRDAGMGGPCPGRVGTVMRHIVDDAVVRAISGALSNDSVRKRIERAIDGALESLTPNVEKAQRALALQESKSRDRVARLVAAIADGTLARAEAAPMLEKLRIELHDIEHKQNELRLSQAKQHTATAERDKLITYALDFPSVAADMEGVHLREFVLMWAAFATFDKVTREFTLGIRRVPAIASFPVLDLPGQAGHKQGGPLIRRITLIQHGHEGRVARGLAALEAARKLG